MTMAPYQSFIDTEALLVFNPTNGNVTGIAAPSGTVTQIAGSQTNGPVASSRSSLAADNGLTLELAASVTYTLDGNVSIPSGLLLVGPASGTATIAVSNGATINGASSSVTVTAGQMYTVIPRISVPTAYVVKGS